MKLWIRFSIPSLHYSNIDLQSAYHQIQIKAEYKLYSAFEAAGGLYQFTRIPLVVTNGVASFQRKKDELISKENEIYFCLPGCSMTQEEHYD